MKHLDRNSRWLRLLTFFLAVCAASFVAATAAEAQTTGTIKGRVFDGETPVAGISVGVFDSNEVYKTMSQTDADGEYELTGLQLPGEYKIYFSTYGTDYTAQWYNNAATFDDAQLIELTVEKSPLDIGTTLLAKGGTVSGTIRDAASGNPISGIAVQAFDINNSSIWFSGTTDIDGLYSIKGLGAGSYKIRFRAFGTNYITAWYSSVNENHAVLDESGAESVAVSGGSVLIDAKLTAGGAVSGKVTIKETGSQLSGVRVNVYSSSDSNVLKGFATTDDRGQYTVSGLASDSTYKVQFFERVVNNAGSGVSKWYNEQPDFTNATEVLVGAVDVNTVISGAVISGITKDEEGALLSNVTVTAYDNSGNIAAVSQSTGEDGAYKIEGLKRGGYKLYFKTLDGSGYISEWFNDKAEMTSADLVTISSLGDRLTKDVVLLKKTVSLPSKAAQLIPIYKQLLLKKRCYIINGVRVCR
ncbi:MAG: MSCRAMM family protein [Candidatus Electronema sp. V4]|uniref:MSCRAMM family protein n=1 Tax=Candidatus Electronema sp. V4 TaxID=3454756 RepID=UPI00405596E0